MKWFVAKIRSLIKNNIKNTLYRLKYRPRRAKKRNVYYCVFEVNKKHTGIADRLKTVILQYDLAKAYGYDFKLFWETPFKLTRYLNPKSDWPASLDELEYSLFDTKIISETVTWRPMKPLLPNKQYHCYRYAGGALPKFLPHTGERWCDLFNELFEPSQLLNDALMRYDIKKKTFVSVHLRFGNALGTFECTPGFENQLESEEEKINLIERCKQGIVEIMSENEGKDVYVFSDSKRFLDSIIDMPVKVLGRENIGHVSESSNEEIQLKAFMDLFVMAKSSAVYRMQAPELFSYSGYSLIAANIGDIPFYNKKV